MLTFYWLDFTTKDHPGLYSLVLYTSWCNFRCYGCHNRTLAGWDYKNKNLSDDEIRWWSDGIIHINPEEYHQKLSEEEVKMAVQNDFLDMIILCWWEVLINKLADVVETINWIKKLNPNVLIRIDTNWSFPEKVEYLKENKLVDGFAIDIKWPYWNKNWWPEISKVIWLPQNIASNIFPKIMESIHIADQMPYTLFRTVHYPIIKDQQYFEEIKNYVRENLKSPHSINPFIQV